MTAIQNLDHTFDAARITAEVTAVLQRLGHPAHQSATLTNRGQTTDELALLSDFVGSLAYVKNKVQDVSPDEFMYLHPALRGSYTSQVIDELMEISPFPIGRVRWAALKARSCYSYHIDFDPIRYHIPLQTDAVKCMFVVADQVYRMPEVGRLYSLDPRQLHTAINAMNKTARVHLLFDTYDPSQDLMPYRRERLEGVYRDV
jgi:hypothetical protein